MSIINQHLNIKKQFRAQLLNLKQEAKQSLDKKKEKQIEKLKDLKWVELMFHQETQKSQTHMIKLLQNRKNSKPKKEHKQKQENSLDQFSNNYGA